MFTSLINRFTSTPTTRPSATGGVELPPQSKLHETAFKQVPTDTSCSIGQHAYNFVTYLPGKLWNSIPFSNQKERAKYAQEKAAFQQHEALFEKLGLSEKFDQLNQAYDGLATLQSWGYHETAGTKYQALRTAQKAIRDEFEKIETYWSKKNRFENTHDF